MKNITNKVAFATFSFLLTYNLMVMLILTDITNIIWVITTLFIIYAGIYFTVKLKFPQFRWIKIFKSFRNGDKDTFSILNLTLAGKIGVGSISGIALCICIGGISSLFWLWISAFILASLTYVETKLGIIYREKYGNEYMGGPTFYIAKGLKKKALAKIYSILIIVAYVLAFISIQTNTIVISIETTFNINKIIIVVFLVIITYLSIHKGVNTISKITTFLTPIMGSLYIITGGIVLFNNWNEVVSIITKIITSAFNFDAFKVSFLVPIIIGIERGIFSNEAGIGTTAMVAALSDTKDVEKQANIQILGTYFTSLIICTITALIVLTSDYQSINMTNINGIEVVSYAFLEHFGYYGIIILTIIIFLFAFSTIVTSYYYGDINTKYLFNKDSKILKIIVIIIIIYSSFMNPTILWNIVDILVALVGIINSYALLKLAKKTVLKE